MGSSEGLGPGVVQPPGLCREVAALTAREAQNQLVVCFSVSVLLADPLPRLVKTNTHSLPDFQVLLLVRRPWQQMQPGEGWGLRLDGKGREGFFSTGC